MEKVVAEKIITTLHAKSSFKQYFFLVLSNDFTKFITRNLLYQPNNIYIFN